MASASGTRLVQRSDTAYGHWYNRKIRHAIEQVLRNRQTELETITITWQAFYRDHPECDASWIPWVCDQICNEFDWANELGTLFLPSDDCAILWRTWQKTWTDDLALPCFFATLDNDWERACRTLGTNYRQKRSNRYHWARSVAGSESLAKTTNTARNDGSDG